MPVRVRGVSVEAHRHVYEPADDTLLLARHLNAEPGQRCLDIGTGSGVLALVLAHQAGRAVATDVSPLALEQARENAAHNDLTLDLVQTDLAAGLAGPFDVVACNPPYLPTTEKDRVAGPLNRAFDGGFEGGRETLRVIRSLPDLLREGGQAMLLVSDLQPLSVLEEEAREGGLGWEVLEEERHGMETLQCVRLPLA